MWALEVKEMESSSKINDAPLSSSMDSIMTPKVKITER